MNLLDRVNAILFTIISLKINSLAVLSEVINRVHAGLLTNDKICRMDSSPFLSGLDRWHSIHAQLYGGDKF